MQQNYVSSTVNEILEKFGHKPCPDGFHGINNFHNIFVLCLQLAFNYKEIENEVVDRFHLQDLRAQEKIRILGEEFYSMFSNWCNYAILIVLEEAEKSGVDIRSVGIIDKKLEPHWHDFFKNSSFGFKLFGETFAKNAELVRDYGKKLYPNCEKKVKEFGFWYYLYKGSCEKNPTLNKMGICAENITHDTQTKKEKTVNTQPSSDLKPESNKTLIIDSCTVLESLTNLTQQIIQLQNEANINFKSCSGDTLKRKKTYSDQLPFQTKVHETINELLAQFEHLKSNFQKANLVALHPSVQKLKSDIDELFEQENKIFNTIGARSGNSSIQQNTFKQGVDRIKKMQQDIISFTTTVILPNFNVLKSELESAKTGSENKTIDSLESSVETPDLEEYPAGQNISL